MEIGKTIVRRRERPESDSERERARRSIRRGKVAKVLAVVVFFGAMVFLGVRMFSEWYKWISMKTEVIEIEKEPSVEVIDERTGKVATEMTTRMKEYIANLEEEFMIRGRKVVRASLPVDKVREVDLTIEGFSGVVKVTIDRNAAVSAEDGVRMLKYLEEQGITEVEYIDVRVERKGYWK